VSVVFLGSKALGLDVLRAASDVADVTGVLALQDDADARSVFADFESAGGASGVPFRAVGSTADVRAALQEWRPSVVVVSGWYRMLPVGEFNPATRFYGLHGSLLPKYRGNAPLVWQVLNGEDHAGVSLFELVDGVDEGDIVGQQSFPIGSDDTIADVLSRAADASVALVRAHLASLVAGTAAPTPQDHAEATYCGLRTPEDGRIDWTWPAKRIHDFVRAQTDPYPGAFTYCDGEVVPVLRTALDPRRYHAVPGRVVERGDDGVVVGTGDGVIRVFDVKAPSLRTRFA
jgi:methionyl-tRNA formyltransferase